MFTKSILRRLTLSLPRTSKCYVVLDGAAFNIKGLVASKAVAPNGPARLWIVAGEAADHQPPAEVYQPCNWLNRQHWRRASR